MKRYKYVLINSVLLFIITAVLEVVLHEFSHFITAFIFHAKDLSLHHNFVDYAEDNLSVSQRIWIASAGPLMSLFIGLVFHFIVIQSEKRNALFLFNLFMAVNGYIGFFGYLMIAPLTVQGDTGFVFHALGFPMWSVILIAVFGISILLVAIKKLTKHFVEMASVEIIADKEQRKQFVQAVIKYPIYCCVVAMLLLNLPVPIWVSILPVFSYFSLFYGFGDALKKEYANLNTNTKFDTFNSVQPIIIVGFVLTVILNRLLVHGFFVH
jgi:hypothetical protein